MSSGIELTRKAVTDDQGSVFQLKVKPSRIGESLGIQIVDPSSDRDAWIGELCCRGLLTPDDSGFAHLYSVDVEHAYRNRGLGRIMVREVLSYLREYYPNLRGLWGEISSTGMEDSGGKVERFYENNGATVRHYEQPKGSMIADFILPVQVADVV